MKYPQFLMKDLLWSFNREQYKTQELFYQALKEYNEKITGKEFDLGNLIAINQNKMIVQYNYWDKDIEGNIEEEIELTADNIFFNKIELLYKIHDFVCGKLKEQDHHFFEGLLLWNGENPNYPNIPYYFLLQGS